MKKLWSIVVLLVLFLGTSSCSRDSNTQPANAAYPTPTTLTQAQAVSPASVTQTNFSITQINSPGTTARPTPTTTLTFTPYPTLWRDFTPTPNLTPGVWPEFSSEITYSNSFNGRVVGPLHFSVRYPPDWYLYPGFTVTNPGGEWQGTYIQNYERIGNIPDEGHPKPGAVVLIIGAMPCNVTEQGCPMDLPLLSPGLPGTQKVTYQSESDSTHWETYLYMRDMRFSLYGYMAGRPEENADLIKTLDKILATVKLR